MNQKQKQIGIIAAVVILMGILFFQPIKGLINEQEETERESDGSMLVTFQSESQRAKQGLNPAIIQEITDLEASLATAETDEEKEAILKQLVEKWDSVNKHSPMGFAYEEIARMNNDPQYWLAAGDAYRTAYGAIQDTSIVFPLNSLAIHAYEQVLSQEADNIHAKAGLGAAYVSGTSNPMGGIALLQEVVQADPDHLDANKSLGLFSMQSRQFDKAIERFQKVVSLSPDAESYFYLATSYENIGLKGEAIAAFEQSKALAADPTLNQFIDRKIEELSK
ncbi:MAG TPA: tetratricopeptide repeat protein [Sphingobacteriaceae bacterium]|nr:tetratricopeptide repeat protein [Sphingobacteriaceae bacterium]